MEDLRKRRSSAGRTGNQKNADYGIAGEEKQQSTQELGDSSRRAEDEKWVWRVCLAFRLLNALLVRTYFNPDEHWQALEVAHRMVFGYGHLTWEWERGIRSYAHPLIFAALYKLLALTGLDTPWVMVLSDIGAFILSFAAEDNYSMIKLFSPILFHFTLPALSRVACIFPFEFRGSFFIGVHLPLRSSNNQVHHNTSIVASLSKLVIHLGHQARAPRLFQALFAAVGDLYLFKLSFQVFGRRTAYWTLFCQMVNWFTFFSLVRTLSNSLETTLTIVALFYWPNTKESKAQQNTSWMSSRQLALTVAALSCVIRPTNGIIWIYMGVLHMFQTGGKSRFLLTEVFPIGVVCLSLASCVDRWMYGRWIIVPLNFLKFNFLSSGGDFYGTHSWHWYFSQGFPVMLFTFLPISVAGIWWAKDWFHAGLICWVLSIYSILGHKEFRFVLPVLPLCMMFAGYGLNILEQKSRSKQDDVSQIKVSTDLPTTKAPKKPAGNRPNKPSYFWLIILGLLATNVPTAIYSSLVHQRGGERVMEYLAVEAHQNRVESVLFLMPCHSTPFYSSLHSRVPMRFLDCSPSDRAGYVDEADRFMANPQEFLHSMFPHGESGIAPLLPSHIVLYDSIEPQVQPFLENHHYKLEQKFFHSHFPVDRELQGHVLAFTRRMVRL